MGVQTIGNRSSKQERVCDIFSTQAESLRAHTSYIQKFMEGIKLKNLREAQTAGDRGTKQEHNTSLEGIYLMNYGE
jgi:hypothetical protein